MALVYISIHPFDFLEQRETDSVKRQQQHPTAQQCWRRFVEREQQSTAQHCWQRSAKREQQSTAQHC